jgi:hypothetical protein
MHSKVQEDYTSGRVSVRCSELTATIGELDTYDNEVCCLLFKCAREFFQPISLCGDPHNFEEDSKSKTVQRVVIDRIAAVWHATFVRFGG